MSMRGSEVLILKGLRLKGLPLKRVLLAGLGVVGLWAGLVQAAGSWVATAPAVRAVAVDRAMASAHMRPGDLGFGRGQIVNRVSWRYQSPTGVEVDAWLCHPAACIALPGQRGQTRELAGLPATTPLFFKFALREPRQPVMVQGLQVIVNHESLEQPLSQEGVTSSSRES